MPAPRIHVEFPLAAGAELALPAAAARHVQVLRLQPGAALTLFDGRGGEWDAQVRAIGRRDVTATVFERHDVERELGCAVTLAVGMPANERMDALIEKATELGAAAIQPLHCERSVLRVAGERVARKLAHWRAIAAAACEQCGRNRLPAIAAPLSIDEWLASLASDGDARLLLDPSPQAAPMARLAGPAVPQRMTVASGPEGGLSPAERAAAIRHGFVAVSLGSRVLRADTAPLAALACIGALHGA